MTFPSETDPIRTAIGHIGYEFLDEDGTAENMSGRVQVQILDQFGSIMRLSNCVDLMPHLTTDEKIALRDLFQRLRGVAEDELLP